MEDISRSYSRPASPPTSPRTNRQLPPKKRRSQYQGRRYRPLTLVPAPPPDTQKTTRVSKALGLKRSFRQSLLDQTESADDPPYRSPSERARKKSRSLRRRPLKLVKVHSPGALMPTLGKLEEPQVIFYLQSIIEACSLMRAITTQKEILSSHHALNSASLWRQAVSNVLKGHLHNPKKLMDIYLTFSRNPLIPLTPIDFCDLLLEHLKIDPRETTCLLSIQWKEIPIPIIVDKVFRHVEAGQPEIAMALFTRSTELAHCRKTFSKRVFHRFVRSDRSMQLSLARATRVIHELENKWFVVDALHYFWKQKCLEGLSVLLEDNHQINLKSTTLRLLHLSVASSWVECIELIISREGFEVPAGTLPYALERGHPKVIESLIFSRKLHSTDLLQGIDSFSEGSHSSLTYLVPCLEVQSEKIKGHHALVRILEHVLETANDRVITFFKKLSLGGNLIRSQQVPLYISLQMFGFPDERISMLEPCLDNKEGWYRKSVGHVLSIDSKTSDLGFEVQTTGGFFHGFYKMIRASLVRNIKDEPLRDFLEDTLTHSYLGHTPELALSRYQKGKPVIIETGFQKHTIVAILWDDSLIYCNKGLSSSRPIREYKITPELVTTDTFVEFSSCCKLEHLEAELKLYNSIIISLMPESSLLSPEVDDTVFSDVLECVSPRQEVGNCAYKSTETAVQALMVRFLDNNYDRGTACFNRWRNTFRLEVVEEYIGFHEEIQDVDFAPKINRSFGLHIIGRFNEKFRKGPYWTFGDSIAFSRLKQRLMKLLPET